MDQRDADSDREFPVDGVGVRAGRLAAELREQARVTAASQARELRLVAALSAEVAAAARAELTDRPWVPGHPTDEELILDAVDQEVAVVLGVSEGWASHLAGLADRLCRVLPDTLAAVEAGRLDLIRARRLADATEDLPDEVARRVEAQVLARCGDAPWDGPSPRTWRDRIDRAIVRHAPGFVRERRARALAERAVRAWSEGDGTGVLRVTADQMDIAMADEVITDLAMQWPEADPTDPAGGKSSMDQRRVDSFMDLLRRVRDGRDLPSLPVRREHDIGLVVPADAYFSDPSPTTPPAPAPEPGSGGDVRPGAGADIRPGPATDRRAKSEPAPATDWQPESGRGPTPVRRPEPGIRDLTDDRAHGAEHHAGAEFADDRADGAEHPGGGSPGPGQVRGLGAVSYLDPASAGELARRQVALGAAITVLLTTAAGVLAGTVRLPAPNGGVWTPDTLSSAISRQLQKRGPLPPDTDRYAPTARQAAFVRARNPRCTAYDCPRASTRCDLDHDRPWPRGPTSVHNLAPRHRRHHEAKTRGLVRTELRPDGAVTTTMLTGLTVTTRPEPLPGYGPGERRPMPLDPGLSGDAAA